MKTLFVLRHAKSSWKDPHLSDFERPLNKRGKRDAPRMGRLLRDIERVPDLILTSSAKRALATAEAFAEAADYDPEIRHTRHFYHAEAETFLDVLATVDDAFERVMVVGHNPGLEELVELLTGVFERMPTAALAQIELPISAWRQLSEDVRGTLVDLWLPRTLD